MQVDGKTLTIGASLWVQYGGVDVEKRGALLALTGRDDESYLKVLNAFGRLLKLFTFEDGRWVDADTGGAAQPFDEREAGQLPGSATPGTAKAAPRSAGKPARAGAKASPKAAKLVAKATAKAPVKTRAKAAPKPTPKSAPRAAAKGAGRGKSARRRTG